MWEALGNTAVNLITATRTVIKAAVIVIFGYGVGWSMAEFDTQKLALEIAPATLIGLDPAKSRQHHFDWRSILPVFRPTTAKPP